MWPGAGGRTSTGVSEPGGAVRAQGPAAQISRPGGCRCATRAWSSNLALRGAALPRRARPPSPTVVITRACRPQAALVGSTPLPQPPGGRERLNRPPSAKGHAERIQASSCGWAGVIAIDAASPSTTIRPVIPKAQAEHRGASPVCRTAAACPAAGLRQGPAGEGGGDVGRAQAPA